MLTALLLSAPSVLAEIHISAEKPLVRVGEYAFFKVELKNVSQGPIQILDIGDGSESHWVNPHIGWSVLPADDDTDHPKDTPVAHLARCGNMNPTTPQMFHTLKPGEASDFGFSPINFDLRRPGKYRVVFYYEVDPKDKPRSFGGFRPLSSQAATPDFGGMPQDIFVRYRALTPLKLRSNEVRFEVKPVAP